MNGTRVWLRGNVLFEHLMDKDRLGALLAYADENGISMGISTGGYDYYIHPEGVVAWTGFAGVFRSAISGMDGAYGSAGEDIGVYRRSGRRQGAGGPFP